jgi:DNA-binding response OmpR family regulator
LSVAKLPNMGPHGVSPLTVVVADDDSLVRMSLRFVLQSRGFRVVEVESGGALGRTVAQTQPAACIIDVNMPGADIMTQIAKVRRNSPSTGILVLSGEAAGPLELTALDIPYLRKPIELTALLDAVNTAIGRQHVALGG